MRWSPDGLYLLGTPRAAQTAAAAARLPPVLVWDAEDGSLFAQLVGNAVAFTRWLPDGRHVLLCADVPLRASMWSLLTGDVVSLPPPKFPTRGVAASASGSVLAMLTRVECKDIVCLLTAGDWQVTARWPTATSDADDCAFCGDSALLLWEGAGGMCVLHDLDGVPLGQFAADAGLGVRLCSLSPDASILAVATVGAPGVVLLNTARFDTICELLHTGTVRGPPSVVVYREVPSEEAASAASVHYALADCPMQLLKAVDKSSAKMGVGECRSVAPRVWRMDSDANHRAGLVAWSSDGQLLATRCDTYPTAVFVWDLPRLQLAALLLHLAPVRDMAWDPATSRLALCTGAAKTRKVHRAPAGTVQLTYSAHAATQADHACTCGRRTRHRLSQRQRRASTSLACPGTLQAARSH